ncbi:MAG: hypothetical protein JSV16_01970, partial [Candidatus Hydrogenedentota bacterium]
QSAHCLLRLRIQSQRISGYARNGKTRGQMKNLAQVAEYVRVPARSRFLKSGLPIVSGMRNVVGNKMAEDPRVPGKYEIHFE